MSYMLYVMGFAAALSLAFSGFMIHVGVGDIPDKRSSHSAVTPTSGGVGIIAAIGGFFLLLPQFVPPGWMSADWPFILTILWAVALLGLWDDIYTISAPVKFAVLIILAGLAVWKIGPVVMLPYAANTVTLPYWAGFLGSVLWVFVVANAVNFMDGANGLMASVMIIALLALAAIGTGLGASQSSALPLAITAGLLGLWPYNFRGKAHIFSGDVGSLVTGFGFALAALWLCREMPQSRPVFIGPILILPFLTDVLLTMIWRAKHGENLLKPHKRHLYQRLIAHGHGHVAVAVYYALTGAVCAIFAYAMTQQGAHNYTTFIIFPALMLACLYYALLNGLKTKGA